MPFVSELQKRACLIKQQQDLEKGIVPRWNCKEFEKGTAKTLPWKVSPRKGAKASKKRTSPRKSPKAIKRASPRKSPRGGKKRASSLRVCPSGQILRVGYTRISPKGKVVKVSPRCIKDVGNVGKSKKTINLTSSVSLRDYGYKMSDSAISRHRALKLAVKDYGKKEVGMKLLKLSILFSNRPQISAINNDIKYVKKL